MAEVVKNVAESLDKDLEILQPEEMFVEVDGEKVYVKPYTFGNLLKAFKHLSALYSTLQDNYSVEEAIMGALSTHGNDVISLISLSTGKPVEFFDTLDAVKGLDLAVMTYKVNESFFAQHLVPKLQELFPSDSPMEEEETTETEEEMVEETPAKPKSKKAGSTSSKN